MKKLMKRIIPLLLVVALIVSFCWYIFVYDRETVRDFLMASARSCAENGHFEAATWFYDISYKFAGDDENVAIDLARIYRDSGNYTKAEYTLVNAIADGATAELYVELCRTYVEQDKLLDAVNMLDKVADPAIKAELDALRPAVPTPDFAPGFYSQYISLTFAQDSGTLYVSTNGQYPTTGSAPCVTPVALEGGETKIYAVTVGDNGLVSPLAILSYTVGGVIEAVELEDVLIEEQILSQLMYGGETVIYSDDLWAITEFTVPDGAKSLADLKYLQYLEKLTITGRTIEDLSFLSGMTRLRELDLSRCTITGSLDPISGLTSLEKLDMSACSISSIAFLKSAPALKTLDLSANAVGNLMILSTIPTLEHLDLRDNAVADLSPLSSLAALKTLDVSENVLTTLAPLAKCTQLTELNAAQNKLTDISAVQSLTALQSFNAAENQITDCSALAHCTELRTLDICKNQITDISKLSTLVKMTQFDFSRNAVTALPAFPASSALVRIDGSYNQLSTLEPLDKIDPLNYVYMDYNAEVSRIAFLADNPNMVQINVFGTKVPESQANQCLDRSIIVNYDPT